MTDWQPIETAPKDGSVIDLWVRDVDYGDGKRVPDAYWHPDDGEAPFFYEERLEGWAAANMGYDGCDGWADNPDNGLVATHWLPKPAEPTAP